MTIAQRKYQNIEIVNEDDDFEQEADSTSN
jgi:hypothetical protein